MSIKRALTTILALCMIVGCLPAIALATETTDAIVIQAGEEKTVEFTHTPGSSSSTVYFSFTPETSGTYVFYYTDNCFGDGWYIGMSVDDVQAESPGKRIQFYANAGQTYQLSAEWSGLYEEGSTAYPSFGVAAAAALEYMQVRNYDVTFTSGVGAICVGFDFSPINALLPEIKVTSSDTSVVTAEAKESYLYLEQVGYGTAVITVDYNGQTDYINVLVKQPIPIELDKAVAVSLEDGEYREEAFLFTAPEDGTYVATWTTGHDRVLPYTYAYSDAVGYGKRCEFSAQAGDQISLDVMLNNRGNATDCQLTIMKGVPLTALSFKKPKDIGFVGEWKYLDLVCEPVNGLAGQLTWTSSDPQIADFDEFSQLNMYTLGDVNVTVTSEYGLSASGTVSVKGYDYWMDLPAVSGELTLGESQVYTAPPYEYIHTAYTFTPEESGSYYFWGTGSSGDEVGIDICYENGGILRSGWDDVCCTLEAGITYVIVFAMYPYEGSDSVQVTVGADNCVPATGLQVAPTYGTLETADTYAGFSIPLTAKFLPVNGAVEDLTWSVSNADVAEIRNVTPHNSSCLLYLKAPGEVTVTATGKSGLSGSFTLTVTEMPRIYLDTPLQITPTTNSYGVALKFIPEVSGWYAFTEDLDRYEYGYLSREIYSVAVGYINNSYGDSYTSAYLEAGQEYIVYYSIPYETETPVVCNALVKRMVPAQSLSILTEDSSIGYVGGDAWLRTEFGPEYAIREEVTWSVDNTDIAALYDTTGESTMVCFDGVGTVTVTATTQSGLTDNITFTVMTVPDLQLDMPRAVTLTKGYSLFNFTPTQSGWYRFSEGYDLGSDVNRSIYDLETQTGVNAEYGYGYMAAYLEAGITYRLTLWLSEYYPEDTATCNVLVEKMSGPESIEVGIEHGIEPYCVGDTIHLYAMTLPEDAAPEAIIWTATSGASLVELETWSNYCYVTLKGAGTVTIQAATASGVADSITFTVTDLPTLPVDSKTQISPDAENPVRYKFTAPLSGWYAFVDDYHIPGMIQTMVIDRTSEFGDHALNGIYEDHYTSAYLEAGKEYEVRFYSFGKPLTCGVHVEKLEDPVSFTLTSHISSTTVLANEWGYDFDYDELFAGAAGTFTWADGTTSEWSYEENGWGYSCMSFRLTTTYLQDDVYTATLDWGSVSGSFDFTVNAKQVQSIEVVDNGNVYLIENAEGSLSTDYNGNEFWEYSTWPLRYALKLKITFTDGTSQTIAATDILYGETVYIESAQYMEPWTIGGENLATIWFGSASTEYNVKIKKNPVTGLSVTYPEHKTKITVGDPAYGFTDENGFVFCPTDDSLLAGMTFTLTYDDGTPARTLTFDDLVESEGMIDGFSVGLYFGDIPEYVKAGDTLTIYFDYLGATDSITIEFVAPKEILDGDDGRWVTDSSEGADIRVNADPEELVEVYVDGKLVDEKHYTVTRGSTIITFTPEFLRTLELGVHDVAIAFTDGRAITSLTITDEANVPGDLDGDGQVNDADVEYLLWHTLFGDLYPITGSADFTGDGIVNDADVEYLLWHTLFGDLYPIN